MPRHDFLRGAFALIALLAAGNGIAAAQVETRSDRPRLQAMRLAQAPVIDGDVLGEELWLDVDFGTGFQQVEPFEGEPASERTEVRIAFDDAALYIAVICFDREASSLAISDSRRDARLQDEDSFRVVLDTFGDRQNGFVFGTNMAGIQYDGQFTNQGRGGGGGSSRSFSSGGANLDWDTSWTVRTTSGDFGWSAEMAIPFRSLRYGSGRAIWGLNFERNIRRNSETSFWAHLGRQHDLFRVSEAGHLVGVEPPRQRNLQLTPYVLSSARDYVEGSADDSEFGMDLKYGVTPSLTLDLTVNTDFAQVEADDQQINLDRFSLFFPEKRPFFLENSGLFRVGGRSSFRGGTELFFSRRIGLSGGRPVPILGGARLSGRAGGFNVGFLNMQTDDLGDIHGNNFTVARVGREYRNRSRAGVLVVNRQGTGSLAPDGDRNRTLRRRRPDRHRAVHGRLGLGGPDGNSRTHRPGPWFRPRRRLQFPVLALASRLCRDRRGLQPRGRFPQPIRLSPVQRLHPAPLPPGGRGSRQGVRPAHVLRRLLELRRLPGNPALLRRRRGRVPERRADQPVRRRPLRGTARAFHPRRHRERAGRGVRRPRLLPVHEHEPGPGREPLHQSPGRRLLRRATSSCWIRP